MSSYIQLIFHTLNTHAPNQTKVEDVVSLKPLIKEERR